MYGGGVHDLTGEDRERLADTLVVASVSGGKDSAAMSLWLTEQGVEHRRVFADTGWEHPSTLDYVWGPLQDKLGSIARLCGPLPMRDLILARMMFQSQLVRFCTGDLKVKPIRAYVKACDADVVNAVGVRAAESRKRSRLTRWERNDDFDCDTWRPG